MEASGIMMDSCSAHVLIAAVALQCAKARSSKCANGAKIACDSHK
jgi:hypothetical protein